MNDSVIGKNIRAGSTENEALEPRNGGVIGDYGVEAFAGTIASHNQVMEREIAERIRKEVDNVVAGVEN